MTSAVDPNTGANGAAGPEPTTTVHRRTCHLCEAMCGLEITVSGGTVQRIK
ncbi:MAG: hypothetical protein HOV66_08065, partial [Streptomycetaceae bacterium]|nr:hypothetical protein [Streptomycetaceae bacterium]